MSGGSPSSSSPTVSKSPLSTIRYWWLRGYGPQAVKLGQGQAGAVRYRLSEVERWERAQEQAQAS